MRTEEVSQQRTTQLIDECETQDAHFSQSLKIIICIMKSEKNLWKFYINLCLYLLFCRYFQEAMDYVRPDVVVLMGDLLDEGSIANDWEFDVYAQRLKRLFTVPDNVKVF